MIDLDRFRNDIHKVDLHIHTYYSDGESGQHIDRHKDTCHYVKSPVRALYKGVIEVEYEFSAHLQIASDNFISLYNIPQVNTFLQFFTKK